MTEKALRWDTLPSAHPLVLAELAYPPDIEEFYDVISHCKGAAVVRMISGLIGEEKFRQGLHEYVINHYMASAATSDLWNYFELTSKLPVVRLMEEWTFTSGYPLVRILEVEMTEDEGGGAKVMKISAKQERFRAIVEEAQTGKWIVPINVISSADPHNVIHSEVIEDHFFSLYVAAAEHSKWFLVSRSLLQVFQCRADQSQNLYFCS